MASPSVATLKQLFAESGNLCAFPKCNEPMVIAGSIVGEVAHIKGARKGAARFDSKQPETERHAPENLLLVCRKHHKIIDDDEKVFTVEKLQDIKREHLRKEKPRFTVSDELAIRLSLFLLGAAAASELKSIARFVTGTIGSVGEQLRKPKPTKSILAELNRSPTGTIVYWTDNPLGEAVSAELHDVFSRIGWSVGQLKKAPENIDLEIDYLFIYVLGPNKDALVSAIAVVLRVMSHLGFERLGVERFIDGKIRQTWTLAGKGHLTLTVAGGDWTDAVLRAQ